MVADRFRRSGTVPQVGHDNNVVITDKIIAVNGTTVAIGLSIFWCAQIVVSKIQPRCSVYSSAGSLCIQLRFSANCFVI